MKHGEDKEQAVVFAWSLYFDELRWMFAVPNGAYLHGDAKSRGMQMNRLKKQGLKAGVADIFLPVAKDGRHGLYIEMKRSDGKGRVSPEQKEFLSAMTVNGYACAVCHGADEAIREISEYMNLGRRT